MKEEDFVIGILIHIPPPNTDIEEEFTSWNVCLWLMGKGDYEWLNDMGRMHPPLHS